MENSFANLFANRDLEHGNTINASFINKNVEAGAKRERLQQDFDIAVASFGDKYVLDFPNYKVYLNTDRFEKVKVTDSVTGEIVEKNKLIKLNEFLEMQNELKKLTAGIERLEKIGVDTTNIKNRIGDLTYRMLMLDERKSLRFVPVTA